MTQASFLKIVVVVLILMIMFPFTPDMANSLCTAYHSTFTTMSVTKRNVYCSDFFLNWRREP